MENIKNNKLPKIIVICGPTASGKTAWSLELARKYNGEIVSADSRQIYKKMNIGTAKEAGKWTWCGWRKIYFVQDIPHYLIDFLDPKKNFTVAEFRRQAIKYIKLIIKNKHLPLVVGGTGLYIDALVNNFEIPKVAPNQKLRENLENLSLEELQNKLKKIDSETYSVIDKKNKRRLVRALEVVMLTGQSFSRQRKKKEPLFEVLKIGVARPREILYNNIEKRVDEQLSQGLIAEVQSLLKQKYGWHLYSLSGIGYRQFQNYFSGQISLAEAVIQLKQATRQYAKRQLTWFRRDKNIHWVENLAEADKLIEEFLKK